jgi:molybdopterin synthase catalytic subunit
VPVAERYTRQVLLWGEETQHRLESAAILVAGVGGLGATVSQLLARAGIGTLYLADDGWVDWPDLNRQLLYTESDIGRAKLAVAGERLRQINSSINLELLPGRIDKSFRLPEKVFLVADCLDNYASRFALEASLPPGTFLVHGGLAGDQGQVLTLEKGRSQLLAEIFSGAVQPQGEIPVTGDGAAMIAGLMVNELFSLIAGQPKLLNRCLVVGLGDLHLSFLEV